VLERVTSLIDKSLLYLAEQKGGESRLTMPETIREYGLECLHKSGEADACQRAHIPYYLALAEKAEPHLKGAQQVPWWKRLEQEQENLRAALARLIEQKEGELALRLGGALWWFWYIRGSWNEGRRWLEAALLLPQAQARTARRAKALHGAGALAHFSGLPAARSLFEESVAISRELGDKRGLAEALDGLA
jgi:predicted ATPase